MRKSRILLLHEMNGQLAANIDTLKGQGAEVVHADHQDLFWPKYIESTAWDAIVIDESVLPHITVELASELGLSMAASQAQILIVGTPPANLPSSMRRAHLCLSFSEAGKMLKID